MDIFTKSPSNRLLCGVCLSVVKDPHQCQNGHCFCHECLLAALRVRRCCPTCTVVTTLQTISRNLFARDSVNELMTTCISCASVDESPVNACSSLEKPPDRCDWIGKLENRQKHFDNDCQYRIVSCVNKGCSERLPRMFLESHAKTCEFGKPAVTVADRILGYYLFVIVGLIVFAWFWKYEAPSLILSYLVKWIIFIVTFAVPIIGSVISYVFQRNKVMCCVAAVGILAFKWRLLMTCLVTAFREGQKLKQRWSKVNP